MTDWKREHFSHVEYEYDDSQLDQERTRIRLVVQVNGKTEIDISSNHVAFEPGVVAFVSKPEDRGLRVVKVLPAPNGHLTDAGPAEPAPEWAAKLLGIE